MSQLTIKYYEDVKEDRNVCRGGYVSRTTKSVDFCCQTAAEKNNGNIRFNNAHDEESAFETAKLFGISAAKFCPFCGATIVMEKAA